MDKPSGHVKIAIEIGYTHVDFHIEDSGSFHSSVNLYQRVIPRFSLVVEMFSMGKKTPFELDGRNFDSG